MRGMGWWVVVGLAAGGCGASPIACPDRGGASWETLRSEHFLVRTDIPDDDARDWVSTLEQVRASLHEAAWHGAPVPPGRLEVVLFRSVQERVQFLPAEAEAITYFDLAGHQLVVAQGGDRAVHHTFRVPGATVFLSQELRPEVSIAHELAHTIDDNFLRRQPLWLAEGLAQVLETVTYDVDAGTATIGAPSIYLVRWFGALQHKPNLASLLAGRKLVLSGEAGAAFYADSWALVVWLLNQRGAQFNRYQGRLRDGEDPDAAWTTEIGTRGDELDKAVRGYLAGLLDKSAMYHTYTVRVRAWKGAVTSAPMTDAQVHALWARVEGLAPSPKMRERVGADLAEAIRLDRLDPEVAELAMTFLSREEQLARARAVVVAHPDDSRAHALLALALEALPERAAELEEAMRLDPQAFQPVRSLARVRVAQGRGEEAVALASRALDLGGVNPVTLMILADGLAASGKCPEAVEVLLRAMDFSSHGVPDATRQTMRERADELEKRGCAPVGAAAR